MTPARILITGSRSWELPSDYVARVLIGLVERHGDIVIVHGACETGVDRAFEVVAKAAGIATEPHPADWRTYGKAAGPRRNAEMVALGAVKCLAFSLNLGKSPGTWGCMNLALGAGIPTWWIRSVDEPPIRQEANQGV